MIEPIEDKRHGLVIRDRFVTWSDITRLYRCRRCQAMVGKPYADPITGELDHDRHVCGGQAEHEIIEEGDLIHARQLDWQEDEQFWQGFEVRGLYGETTHRSASLYDDDPDFEGW